MKSFKRYSLFVGLILSLSSVIQISSLYAQLGVADGWKGKDSIRFALFSLHDIGSFFWGDDTTALYQANRMVDSLGVNFDMIFGDLYWGSPLIGHNIGSGAYGTSRKDGSDTSSWPITNFTGLGQELQQRIYYADSTPFPLQWDNSYQWRYNDLKFNPKTSVHRNTYDSNDVSSYVEYQKNDSISGLTFSTKRFNVSHDSTVTVGNEGRVILGFSDNRLANQLLLTSGNYNFFPGHTRDTARAFSATLEFNIDTSSILTTGGFVGKDTLPLLRFQILYKKGGKTGIGSDTGYSILPFVPFKTITDTLTKPGWFKVIDTTITKMAYDSLPDSWRKEDITENGTSAHSWHFKQLHVLLKDMPRSMRDQIVLTPDNSIRTLYGTASDSSVAGIKTFFNPDSLVSYLTPNKSGRPQYLLETRVLSTYRATVRVRSMTWQDTVIDKFLYRKRYSADSTHSLSPKDGSYGGYDDLMAQNTKAFHDSCEAHMPGKVHEVMYNDVAYDPQLSALAMSGIAYIDYMLGKRGHYHTHIREQDFGGSETQQFRRERLAYDLNPPSMYENQMNIFYSDHLASGKDLFPHDYVFFSDSAMIGTPWGHSSRDTMMGVVIARMDTSANPLAAYKKYTYLYGGLNNGNSDAYKGFIPALRNSTRSALSHPAVKRFAIETDIQGWGLWFRNFDSATGPHPAYNQRPTTPEETQGMIYSALANGVSAFSIAQAFDADGANKDGGDACLAGPQFGNVDITGTVPVVYVHNYNFGHRNSRLYASPPGGSTNYLNPDLPNFYLGFSNTFRAFQRAMSRVNNIYDTTHGRGKIPLRRFSWLDSYSANSALGSGSVLFIKDDSLHRSKAFLKCDSTVPVKRWSRGANNAYIDSLNSSGRADSAKLTYVEVGLFKDSINSTSVNYATLLVNTRLWPSLRDAVDSIYYNQGLTNSVDRSRSTLGDIDTRKVILSVDTNNFPSSFRSSYYRVHDLWHPDSLWIINSDSTFSTYLKPGDAAFMYFEPVTPVALGHMSSNLYNNARHIVPIEDSLGVHGYLSTYIRDGKVVVSYPKEVSEGYNHRKAGIPIDAVIDSTHYFMNPAIAYNPVSQVIGLIYASDSSGNGVDTNKIWYREALLSNPYLFGPAHLLNTIKISHSADPTFLATPAITPCYDSSAFYFWVSWRAELTNGGLLGLIQYPGNLVASQYFYASSLKVPKFISITSNKFIRGARLAWEEYNSGFTYIYHAFGQQNSGTISVTTTQNISPDFCLSHHPQIATDGNGVDEVAWEAYGSIRQKPNTFFQYANTVVHRTLVSNKWSNYDEFFPVSHSLSTIPITLKTFTLYPSITKNNVIQWLPPGGMRWHDWTRIFWNNQDSGHTEIVHYGVVNWPATWQGAIMRDISLEPASAQCTLIDSLAEPILFRDSTVQSDGDYIAEVTCSNFPVTPVREPKDTLVWKQIKTNPLTFCIGVTSLIGGAIIKRVDSLQVVGLLAQGKMAPDTVSIPVFSPLSWADKTAGTQPFRLNPNDTLHYWRSFDLGDNDETADTTGMKDALYDSTDYIKASVCLRKLSDSSLVATLDTAILKKTGFFHSAAPNTTEGLYIVHTGFPADSIYMDLEVSRGNPSNLWTISLSDIYANVDDIGSTSSFKKASREWQPSSVVSSAKPVVTVIPNPFHQTASVTMEVPEGVMLNVTIFDELGRKVRDFINTTADQTHYEFTISSETLATGIYYLRVQSGSAVVTEKVQLLK